MSTVWVTLSETKATSCVCRHGEESETGNCLEYISICWVRGWKEVEKKRLMERMKIRLAF
jgi:hypothetical protein